MSDRLTGRTAVAFAILFALAAVPCSADAQLGRLRKLKNAISPDSAARVAQATADSITIAARLAVGDSTPLKRSTFSRGVRAAAAASAKFEQVTGVSATDAALAATGVGAAGVVAKRLGVDPTTVGTNAVRNAVTSARSKAGTAATAATTAPGLSAVSGLAGAAGVPGVPSGVAGVAGMPNMADMARLQADMMALQQEMMRLTAAAGAGDVVAQGKVRRWEAITLRYKAEMERLAVPSSAGDMRALTRLQEIQTLMLREWVGAATPAPTATPAPRRARP